MTAKRKKTGGRKAGTPNKATAKIRELAQKHAPKVIAELARLALKSESDQARVAAIRELLDRGFGKPAQPLIGDEDNPLKTITEVKYQIVDPKG